MAAGRNAILADVVLYLKTVLVAEPLSERAEKQRKLLLEKLSRREISPQTRGTSYMDMNQNLKGLSIITKSNSFACLHQQAAYEELCLDQPIYNNEEDDVYINYEPFMTNSGYSPPKNPNEKRHSVSSVHNNYCSMGSLNKFALNGSSSLSSQSTSDSSESSKSDVIYVPANTVKYSASKYGVLMKREKILFVDHTRKYWAAVLSSTMYVYNGEKDLKPCLVIHLEGYTARVANGAGNCKNKDWSFEIVCPGNKSYQFITQNQTDMHFWIEAINNSSSKPPTPEIVHSPSPILSFKQDQLLPNRKLPVPPTVNKDALVQDYCYDKPNSIIRPVNLYENAIDEVDMESIYQLIDESKEQKELSPKSDNQFCNGDTSYYNIPSNIPVPVPPKEDQNNNEYDGDDYFAEKETNYDIVTNDEYEMSVNPVLGVQQIIQKLEEINSKKTSPFLRRKSQPKNNSLMRNSTPVYTSDEFYEPMKVITNRPNNAIVCNSQSFRKAR